MCELCACVSPARLTPMPCAPSSALCLRRAATSAGASCSGWRGGAGGPAVGLSSNSAQLDQRAFPEPRGLFPRLVASESFTTAGTGAAPVLGACRGVEPPQPLPSLLQGSPLRPRPPPRPRQPCRPGCSSRGRRTGGLVGPMAPESQGAGVGGTGRDGGPWQTVSDRAANHSLLCGQRLVTQGRSRCWPTDHCSVRAARPALGGEASLAGQRHPPNKSQGRKPGPLRQGGLTGHS